MAGQGTLDSGVGPALPCFRPASLNFTIFHGSKNEITRQFNLLRFLDGTHQLLVNGKIRGLDFGLDWENF